MADVNIDVARAQDWVKRVKDETRLTENTLNAVREICTEGVGEQDTVIQLITSTGNMLNEAWTATTSAFKNAWDKVEEGIGSFGSAGVKIEESFEELRRIIR